MKQEKMKRSREEYDDESDPVEFLENKNNGKKRDVCGINLMKDEGCSSEAWESHLGLGVFDFPWLKDGVTSKSEKNYLFDFEDNFSSFLEVENASFSVDSSKANDLWETPEPLIPETKLEDISWQPFQSEVLELEAEGSDCIWGSLLNQPL